MRPNCDGPSGIGIIMGMLLLHYPIALQLYQLAMNYCGGNIFCPKQRITPQSFSPETFSVSAIVGTSAYLLNSIERTGLCCISLLIKRCLLPKNERLD